MKSVLDWLAEMETEAMAQAPARGRSVLVSGRVRIDCEYLPKVDMLNWQVDGCKADRETAGRALEHARAFKDLPFSAKRR